jgi:hypothetical protein
MFVEKGLTTVFNGFYDIRFRALPFFWVAGAKRHTAQQAIRQLVV